MFLIVVLSAVDADCFLAVELVGNTVDFFGPMDVVGFDWIAV